MVEIPKDLKTNLSEFMKYFYFVFEIDWENTKRKAKEIKGTFLQPFPMYDYNEAKLYDELFYEKLFNLESKNWWNRGKLLYSWRVLCNYTKTKGIFDIFNPFDHQRNSNVNLIEDTIEKIPVELRKNLSSFMESVYLVMDNDWWFTKNLMYDEFFVPEAKTFLNPYPEYSYQNYDELHDIESSNSFNRGELLHCWRVLCDYTKSKGIFDIQNLDVPNLDIINISNNISNNISKSLNNSRFAEDVIQWKNIKFRSHSEVKIAEELDRRGLLFLPKSAVRLTTKKGRENQQADFLVFHRKKYAIIQVDGVYHGPEIRVEEQQKERDFERNGIRVFRFDSEVCYNNPRKVVDEFLELIELI
ncbi:hypothetical protein [Okeania sp.]|uniref:hypothetical protein n=1 Tax=Okeania sp. TaxID=3100323 RepID=UPI002B4AF1C8|nr:hypothetical protein [Okeania sp.]MEB3340433.1 hypothetical protein [Okeania sp.]